MRSEASRGIGFLRRHALGAVAIFLVVGGSSIALARSGGGGGGGRIYACVTGNFHTLNLTTADATCPNGQRKISWNEKGERGKKGKTGKAGPAGPKGPKGDTGKKGATGATGVAGARGPAGTQGATGVKGSIGATGQNGAKGATGHVGATGARGATGIPGPIGQTGPSGPTGPGTFLMSSAPVTVTTNAGGSPNQSEFLALSGTNSSTNGDNVVEVFPGDGTITALRGQVTNTNAMSLVGSTLSIQAQLFQGSGGGTPTPTPLTCNASPSYTGIVAVGTTATFSCTGLSHAVAAGDTGYVEINAFITAGITMATTFTGQAAVSLAVQ